MQSFVHSNNSIDKYNTFAETEGRQDLKVKIDLANESKKKLLLANLWVQFKLFSNYLCIFRFLISLSDIWKGN